MLAQHFDYIYFYAKELHAIHDRSNPLFEGLSKDSAWCQIYSFPGCAGFDPIPCTNHYNASCPK